MSEPQVPNPPHDGKPPNDSEQRYELFLQLFSEHRERLFAYVHAMLPHRVDAEDVFQRCSLVLWRKFEHFEADKDFLAWACGVAYFEVRNFLRVSARDHLQFNDELVHQLAQTRITQLTLVDERIDALRKCLDKLDEPDRRLVKCAYDDTQSVTALATATGRAVQSLYNRLTLLRRRLHECVEQQMSMEGLV